MMRANIKQQRWDHTNSLLTTDISLERKKKLNLLLFHERIHFFCNKTFKLLRSKMKKQSKTHYYKLVIKFCSNLTKKKSQYFT